MYPWEAPELRRQIYENREISWLRFNYRVLEEACDPSVPLFERLRFVSIFCSNLDEFFMIRVGGLYDQAGLPETVVENKTLMSPQQQLDAIFAKTKTLMPEKDLAYQSIVTELAQSGVSQAHFYDLSNQEQEYVEQFFENELHPLISPQIIDKQHPFPFLKNKVLYVGVHLATKGEFVKLGIIPITDYFDRLLFLPTPSGLRFLLVEEVIQHYADRVFSHYKIVDRTVFRITRNADINAQEALDDHETDYREAMEMLIKRRRKLQAVRLELQDNVNLELMDYICQRLELPENQVLVSHSPLDMSFIYQLEDHLDKGKYRDLFYDPIRPQPSPDLEEGQPIIRQLEKKDVLLAYPYEDIKPFIQLLEQSAFDPEVVSIKITLYRVASNSQVVNALIRAAENGKDVLTIVELQARFDEENNIGWSKRLEEAGCTVIYGLPGYKVHSKLLLITRKAGNNISYTTQVGTGNYNEKTARLYTDYSYMTSRREIGLDAIKVFNAISVGEKVTDTNHLMVAPLCFKTRVLELIDQEIACAREGQPALIRLKLNGLSDKEVMDKLIQASMAGAKVDLIVRGICCLRSQVAGFTENITVRSIVGRYLEHARVYVFGVGARQSVWISSGDFLTRNCVRRVEVATPIYDFALRKRLLAMLEVMLQDTAKSRVQNAAGLYERVPRGENGPLDSQRYFCKEAAQSATLQSAQRQSAVLESKKKQSSSVFHKLFSKKERR